MFCSNCGAQHPDDARVCPSCGIELQPEETQAPVYQAPVYQSPLQQSSMSAPQKKMAVIIALIAIFALIVGFAHTFCMVKLPVSASADIEYDEMDIDIKGSVNIASISMGLLNEAYDMGEEYGAIDKTFAMGYVGVIVFGIINLLIAVVGILYYLKAKNGNPLFDQFFGRFCAGKSPAVIMGLAGVAGVLIEILCLWCVSVEESAMGMSAGLSVGANWMTWVALAVYGALAGYQLLNLNKDEE